MDKKTLTMYGSCVISNIFSQAREKNILNFTLKNRFFQINPISVVKSEPLEFLFSFEPEGRFNTAISSIKKDIRKNVFEIIEGEKTDFFVIEQISLYYNLLKIEYKDKIYLLTWLHEAEHFNKNAIYSFLDGIGAKYSVVDSRAYIEEIEDIMTQFCTQLLKYFKPEQIIFVETVPARLCIRKNGLLDYVTGADIDRNVKYMQRVSKAFLDNVKGCHVIPALNPMISSWKNIFGVSPVHYDPCYYEYAYQAVETATKRMDSESEDKELSRLQMKYSGKMKELQDNGMNNLLNEYRKLRLSNNYDHLRSVLVHSGKVFFLNAVEDFNHLPKKERKYGGGVELNGYIKSVLKERPSYVLLMSISDSGSKYWDKFTERQTMGLRDEIGFRTSYLAVYDVDTGDLVEKYDATNKEIAYDCNIITQDSKFILSPGLDKVVQYFNVLVSSKAWEWNANTGDFKCWARILINNIDYSQNKTGLNVVVFSKTEQCVVDSFSVNLHSDPELTIIR